MLDRTDDISASVENWLTQFERALADRAVGALRSLFLAESYWRDALALSWNLQTVNGVDAITNELAAVTAALAPCHLKVDPERARPRRVARAGTETIEAIFKFETRQGRGHGMIRLVPDVHDGN